MGKLSQAFRPTRQGQAFRTGRDQSECYFTYYIRCLNGPCAYRENGFANELHIHVLDRAILYHNDQILL
jgi:hypothetical protein